MITINYYIPKSGKVATNGSSSFIMFWNLPTGVKELNFNKFRCKLIKIFKEQKF